MLAGMLALLLGAAPAAHAHADSVSFHRFSFRYETGWGDCIDTREGTIDMPRGMLIARSPLRDNDLR